MDNIGREYRAWIVCGVFKATPNRGQLGPFPMYESIGDMLPFFKTKKSALQWCRDHGFNVPGPLGIHFRRVVVKSEDERCLGRTR